MCIYHFMQCLINYYILGLLVDHSDLTSTDWPSSIPLPTQLHLAKDVALHDEVREWILAVSMDQKVDQVKNCKIAMDKFRLHLIDFFNIIVI